MSYLEIKNVTKKFGGLVANRDVSFDVQKGEILGLIGPNGAGKTTLFNSISGFFAPTSGKVVFDNNDITGKPSNQICRMGIGRTFQIPMSLDILSVLDNVTVGAMVHTPSTRQAREYAMEILDFVELSDVGDMLAGSLSVIQKKRLEIARALATKPKLLMLDECMAGLHGVEREKAIDLIMKINASGITIIVVEHVMQVVMGVCQRLVVLHYGEKISEGSPKEVTSDPNVISAYLGESYVYDDA